MSGTDPPPTVRLERPTPGDLPVAAVDQHPGAGDGVPLPVGGPAELFEGGDDQVEPRGAVAVERGELARRVVGEDDVEVVVGVTGGHAVVGPRALEDEPDDGRGGLRFGDERREIQRHVRSLRISVHIVSYRWSEPSSASTSQESSSRPKAR